MTNNDGVLYGLQQANMSNIEKVSQYTARSLSVIEIASKLLPHIKQ